MCDENNKEGITIFTKSFNSGRRSWHLKIDVDKDQSVSMWLVERGYPIGFNLLNGNFNIPHFSSVIMELGIKSGILLDRSTPIFYSFAHETN